LVVRSSWFVDKKRFIWILRRCEQLLLLSFLQGFLLSARAFHGHLSYSDRFIQNSATNSRLKTLGGDYIDIALKEAAKVAQQAA